MADKLPLVLDLSTGGPQQLQVQDDLNIPLRQRVETLERAFSTLIASLAEQGVLLPDSVQDSLLEDI